MADTAYDADHLRRAIAANGALAVIPNNPSRTLKYSLDKHLYAQRHLVECCFFKLKQFRRVATRFEKPPKLPGRRHSRSHQSALKAKGRNSAQVVAVNIDKNGVLTMFTKAA